MNVDINKVNLLEKDIEEFLYHNRSHLDMEYSDNPITRWIGRQYQLPSGIADLIGVRKDGMLVVIEVKNVAINKAAILQVCRYAEDLKYVVSNRMGYPHLMGDNEPLIEMVVIGPGIDSQTFTEALAVNVRVFQFAVTLSLDVNRLKLTRESQRQIGYQREKISERPEWDIYGLTTDEEIQRNKETEYLLLTDDSGDDSNAMGVNIESLIYPISPLDDKIDF